MSLSKAQLEEIYQYVKKRQIEESEGFIKKIESQRKKYEMEMRKNRDDKEEKG